MDNRKTVTSALFKKRQPDFQLIGSRNESKSLLKEIGRFSPTEGERFGGHAGALGPQLKASSRMEGQPKKILFGCASRNRIFCDGSFMPHRFEYTKSTVVLPQRNIIH